MRTLIATLALLFFSSCATNWNAVHTELELLTADLADASAVVSDPDLSDDIAMLGGALATVDAALEEYLATSGSEHTRLTLLDALSFALLVAEDISGPDAPDEVKLALFALRSALRRWRSYLEAGGGSGQPVAS